MKRFIMITLFSLMAFNLSALGADGSTSGKSGLLGPGETITEVNGVAVSSPEEAIRELKAIKEKSVFLIKVKKQDGSIRNIQYDVK